MSCKYYHNATSATAGTNVVTLDFAEPATVTDKQRFCFRLLTAIPTAALTYPVQLTVNGTTVPLWNKYGNPVIGGDLTQGKLVTGFYGATNPHVIGTNIPCKCGCV